MRSPYFVDSLFVCFFTFSLPVVLHSSIIPLPLPCSTTLSDLITYLLQLQISHLNVCRLFFPPYCSSPVIDVLIAYKVLQNIMFVYRDSLYYLDMSKHNRPENFWIIDFVRNFKPNISDEKTRNPKLFEP